MKAKAKGTPAKFEATPEKVDMNERRDFGSPPMVMPYAMKNPRRPPRAAETALMRIVTIYELTILGFSRWPKLASVKCPP